MVQTPGGWRLAGVIYFVCRRPISYGRGVTVTLSMPDGFGVAELNDLLDVIEELSRYVDVDDDTGSDPAFAAYRRAGEILSCYRRAT